MAGKLKIAVKLHEGEKSTVKIWRFDEERSYTKAELETNVTSLFPHLAQKKLTVNLYHIDDMVGRVNIESDADVMQVLESFVEENQGPRRTRYLTLHAEDTLLTNMSSEKDFSCSGEVVNSSSSRCSLGKRKRQCSEQSIITEKDVAEILSKCDSEDLTNYPDYEQPLFIDPFTEQIKCKWCPSWAGSVEAKVCNQHTRKSKSHKAARIEKLRLEEATDTTVNSLRDCSPSYTPNTSEFNSQANIEDVKCQGIYQKKYSVLHEDRAAGGTTAKKLWEDSKQNNGVVQLLDGSTLSTNCECCSSYLKWKSTHILLAKSLQSIADEPTFYQIFPKEHITLNGADDTEVQYVGTIRALKGAPKGACRGTASSSGPHPYTCIACNALIHGKTSVLNRKLLRSSTLKHPRSDHLRATKIGVNHKFCATQQIDTALSYRKANERKQQRKISTLVLANKNLYDSWHKTNSAKPFMRTLISLLEENQLTDFDFAFLQNWVGKKAKGRFFKADDQARNLSILFSNKLGEKIYTTVAPILGLPAARQAKRIRSNETATQFYMPGLNDWAFEIASVVSEKRPLQNSMDGTRIIRTVELYHDKYLVGREFPPDVRKFKDQIVEATTISDVQMHILQVRSENKYSSEAYSFLLTDTSGKHPDLLTGSIPEAKSGVTGECVLSLMLEVEKYALRHNLPLVGHCTDSATNALSGLISLATPSNFTPHYPLIKFVGLSFSGFRFLAPCFRSYPAIAYPCWDHSGRTVIRNLLNKNITIVCGTLPNPGDGLQKYVTACCEDLKTLKARYSCSTIRHSDINKHIKQNCDATIRVITNSTIQELATHVPESKGTQLYLQAAMWTHEPFRNNKFGSPPEVARSLWAGLMTWRRWRRYIQLTPGLTLTNNFISYGHYMTEELLVHAGINHQLVLFLCFPNLPLSDYSLRNTGNRGIEAIHSIFRGGTATLPITSPNLSFCEFLTKMNKTLQTHQAEHKLKQITGNTIVASKKKRLTSAKDFSNTNTSNENGPSDSYVKPKSYDAFVTQLEVACSSGDTDSKQMIEKLAPAIKSTLEAHKEWDNPSLAVEDLPPNLTIVSESTSALTNCSESVLNELIDIHLGPLQEVVQGVNMLNEEVALPQVAEAYANYLTDIEVEDVSSQEIPNTKSTPNQLKQHLKYLQPNRERPSKDRSRRFAVGDLPLDLEPSCEHNLRLYQYWTVNPMNAALRAAKVFLLGQVIYLCQSDKPIESTIKTNPNVLVMLNMFKYEVNTNIYLQEGRSGLIKASKFMLVDVSDYITTPDNSKLSFNHVEITELSEYQPFYENINLDTANGANGESDSDDDLIESDSNDPFIVEKIIKKRYNKHKVQYEYFVKWIGYAESENTWELAINIPSAKIQTFEQSLLRLQPDSACTSTRREGLRDRATRRITSKDDYILNI